MTTQNKINPDHLPVIRDWLETVIPHPAFAQCPCGERIERPLAEEHRLNCAIWQTYAAIQAQLGRQVDGAGEGIKKFEPLKRKRGRPPVGLFGSRRKLSVPLVCMGVLGNGLVWKTPGFKGLGSKMRGASPGWWRIWWWEQWDDKPPERIYEDLPEDYTDEQAVVARDARYQSLLMQGATIRKELRQKKLKLPHKRRVRQNPRRQAHTPEMLFDNNFICRVKVEHFHYVVTVKGKRIGSARSAETARKIRDYYFKGDYRLKPCALCNRYPTTLIDDKHILIHEEEDCPNKIRLRSGRLTKFQLSFLWNVQLRDGTFKKTGPIKFSDFANEDYTKEDGSPRTKPVKIETEESVGTFDIDAFENWQG